MKTKAAATESSHTSRVPDASPASLLGTAVSAPPFFRKAADPEVLRVGAPGDAYEREADAVADTVAGPGVMEPRFAPLQRITPLVQRTEVAEEEEVSEQTSFDADLQLRVVEPTASAGIDEDMEEHPVQALSIGGPPASMLGGEDGGGVAAGLELARGRGAPLPDEVRRRMEAHFDTDFSGIRIHTDALAAQLTTLLRARAFAHGGDLFFAPGAFAPDTRRGEHLLAHELTHTIQQGAAAGPRSIELGGAPTVIQRAAEPEDEILVRPELLEAIRIARGEIGKVDAKRTNADGTRIGWERLYDYFFTAFGDKEVIHKEVIRKITRVKKDDREIDAMPSWCGIFVWWAYKRAGIPIPDWKLGGSILHWVRTRAPGELPRKGDIAYKGPAHFDHFALVSGVESSKSAAGKSFKSILVATVNGNTAGDDNLGGQVQEKWEPIGRWLAFFDPVARLDLPPVALVSTGVEPGEFKAEAGEDLDAAEADAAADTPLTDVSALEDEEVRSAPDLPAAGEAEVAVEVPDPPSLPPPEPAAPVEAVSLEGSPEGAMSAFLGASPSRMARTHEALGPALEDRLQAQRRDEAENAPVLTAQTSGRVDEGLTPPGQIPVPSEARVGDGPQRTDSGLLTPETHENRGPPPSNEREEKVLDEQTEGGFLDWLRSNLRNFLSRIRTRDPGLRTSAGRRPNVSLEREADPAQMDGERAQATDQLRGQRDEVTDALRHHPGQGNIQPREIHEPRTVEIPAEASVELAALSDAGATDYAEAPLPADVRGRTDDLLSPDLQANLAEAADATRQAAEDRDRDRQSEIRKAEDESARINQEADLEQRKVVTESRGDVARRQKEGIEEAYGEVNEFNRSADAEQRAVRSAIATKVRDSEQDARTTLEEGEAKAEREREKGEREAAERKRELERDQEKESWWKRAGRAVKKAVKAVTRAIDAVFTKVREAVKAAIEKAKNAAIGLINKARNWVINRLNDFREWAKKAVDALLRDRFPALADRINRGIDAVVDKAIDRVNQVADAAIAGIEALADALAAALDRILEVFQTALKAAVQIAGAVLTGDFAEALRIAIQAACDIAGIDAGPVFDFIDRAAAQILSILRNPVPFFNNVFLAIGTGISNFGKNILEHLKKGLIAWLTGTLTEAGVTLPETFDLRGVFSLVAQILGLTYANIKARIIRKFPAAEKIFDLVEKGFALIMRLRELDFAGLWEEVKTRLSNLYDTVVGRIRNWVVTTVIEQGIVWLLSLTNPASALVKAIKLIYDLIKWLIERFNQIKDFVVSVFESVSAIAAGRIAPAAKAVEDSLSRLLPVVISMIASFLGLGNLAKTIREIIETVTAPVNRAIDWVIDKVVDFARGLWAKTKEGAAAVKEKIKEFLWPSKPFTAGKQRHRLFFRPVGGVHRLHIESMPQTITAFLTHLKTTQAADWDDDQWGLYREATAIVQKEIAPLEEKINDAGGQGTDEQHRTMLGYETKLSERLTRLLGTSNAVAKAVEKYQLEGLTGTYASLFPKMKGDEFTPDHQPQAAALEHAKDLPFFAEGPEGEAMRRRAAGRAVEGYAIALHRFRHYESRTYGKSIDPFRTAVKRATSSLNDPAAQRRAVVDLLKAELEDDIDHMNRIKDFGDDHKAWRDFHEFKGINDEDRAKLIKDSKAQILRGKRNMMAQNLDELAG